MVARQGVHSGICLSLALGENPRERRLGLMKWGFFFSPFFLSFFFFFKQRDK